MTRKKLEILEILETWKTTMKQAELIEAAKKAIQGSEAETARRVEVTPQTLSSNHPPAEPGALNS